MKKRHFIITGILLLFFNVHLFGEQTLQETRIPDTVKPGTQHLLELVTRQNKGPLELQRIEAMLDFVASDKKKDALYYTESISRAPSAYGEFQVSQNLESIIRYAFNPDIPGVVLSPSSVRFSLWTQIDGEKRPLPKLWEYLDDLSEPVIINGVERIENTPDLNSGAYFGYDLFRTLILCKYQGRNVLISMSDQKEVSDVGKKGHVIGSDDEWNYLYTKEAGLTKNGLGWVKSYIYSSFSIIVYMESADSTAVKCGVFKWIRAGWAGINMVNKRHIHEGIERFAKAFKQIAESPNLPEPDHMAEILSKIPAIPTKELKDITWAQLQQLKTQYAKVAGVSHLLADKSYVDKLTRMEMEAFVAKEYVKGIITNDKSKPIPRTLNGMEGAAPTSGSPAAAPNN